jgi:hypothetical protein
VKIVRPQRRLLSVVFVFGALGVLVPPQARADFVLGAAGNYGLLFEGAGGNTLQITNVTVNGNIGVGMSGKVNVGGPSNINGSIDLSAANTGQFSSTNPGNFIAGGVNFGVGAVTSGLNTVNALNVQMGGLSGKGISIGGTTVINAGDGVLSTINGVGYRVFTVTSFNTVNSNTLTIVGDAARDNVVFNFTSSANFNNQVALSGINADSVLWNFVGGSGLTGGPTLQINTNASSFPNSAAEGIFLDPNGPISVVNANVFGRVFGGDTHDFQYVSGSTLTSPGGGGPVVPVPPTFILALFGASPLGVLAWRRRRRSVSCA